MNPVLGLLVVITVLAGITPVAAKMAVTELPAFTIPFFRFGVAGGLLWLTLRLRGSRLDFSRRELPALLVLAAVCVPINQFGFLVGTRLANASHAGLFYALAPVLVFWVAVAMRQVHYNGVMLLAALIAVAGAALTVWPSLSGGGASSSMLVGDLLLVFAIFSWSCFVVLSKPLIARHGVLRTLTAAFLLGTAMQAPLVLIDVWTFDPAAVTWRGAAGLAYLTLMASYTNYLLTYLVLARYDATRAMIVTNGNFIITVMIEYFAFGERLTWHFFAGAALIVSAIALDALRAWRTVVR